MIFGVGGGEVGQKAQSEGYLPEWRIRMNFAWTLGSTKRQNKWRRCGRSSATTLARHSTERRYRLDRGLGWRSHIQERLIH